MRDLYIRRMSLPEPLPRESYLNELPVVKHLAKEGIDFHRQVTFFVGENGSGKSTLIEALAVSQGFNPEGGTKNFRFSTEDSHSELCNYLRVARGWAGTVMDAHRARTSRTVSSRVLITG